MPSLAILSIRGVGIVPPYTPKVPQPTLSTRMKTMLGFFSCATAGATADAKTMTRAQPNDSSACCRFIILSLISDTFVVQSMNCTVVLVLACLFRRNIRVGRAGFDGRGFLQA